VTAASGAPSESRPGEESKDACSPVAPGESANEPSGETTQKPAAGAGSGEKKALTCDPSHLLATQSRTEYSHES